MIEYCDNTDIIDMKYDKYLKNYNFIFQLNLQYNFKIK